MKARAIFCSDIHLSHKAPGFRSLEPDWYQAMRRPLRELTRLAKRLEVPVICAGDIFDRWMVPPELINFAIQEFPKCYAVPGQHDLPNHVYEDIERSAYWTLVEAGVVQHIEKGTPTRTDYLELHGFPWGSDPSPCTSKERETKIAVVHKYCWTGQYKYPQAPKENEVGNYTLAGYDAAVFGDNHIGWIKGTICNCGGFYRRTSADLNRQPFVGVLMSDGTIKRHLLDTSDDVYSKETEASVAETGSIELAQFTEGLLGLKSTKDLDFGVVLQRYCKTNNIEPDVVKLISNAVEEER